MNLWQQYNRHIWLEDDYFCLGCVCWKKEERRWQAYVSSGRYFRDDQFFRKEEAQIWVLTTLTEWILAEPDLPARLYLPSISTPRPPA